MIVMGVDTDSLGSVAVLDASNLLKLKLGVWRIPTQVKVLKSGKKRRGVDSPALVALIQTLMSNVRVDKAYLEEQWSRPMQQAPATFSFGKTYGSIITATASAFMATGTKIEDVEKKIAFVPGNVWKPVMKLGADKSLAVKMADELFPSCKYMWKGKRGAMVVSSAEAALIALYAISVEGVEIKYNNVQPLIIEEVNK